MRSAILQRFGQNLRRLRTERAWTQEQLAEKAGCHPNYVGGLERGERNPTLTTLLAVSRALQRQPAEMLAGLTTAATDKKDARDAAGRR